MSILELTGAESCKECGERAQAERDRLQAENAMQLEWIREAVRFMGCVTECDVGGWVVWMNELVKKAKELGVDA